MTPSVKKKYVVYYLYTNTYKPKLVTEDDPKFITPEGWGLIKGQIMEDGVYYNPKWAIIREAYNGQVSER